MLPLYLRGSNIYLVRRTGPEIIYLYLPQAQNFTSSKKMPLIIILSDQEGFQSTLFLIKESTNIPLNCVSQPTPHLKGTSE